ncbi:MAG: lysophospholipid acyltransferase family protein [Bacteroidales bacterium]
MIPARHHKLSIALVRLFYRFRFRTGFSRVRIIDPLHFAERPLILIGNHFSWWDGFFADHINAKLFHRKLHIMMLEEQLKPRMFLNKAGAFSIDPGKRDMIESIEYSAEILRNPENILVMYPQGEIQSMHRQLFTFNPGITRIYRKFVQKAASPDLCLVFYTALPDYLSESRPSVNIYLKEFPSIYLNNTKQLEAAFQSFYFSCTHKQDQ